MKKLNLTVTLEAVGTVTIEVPDDMTFDEAMTWAKLHKDCIPVPANPDILDNIIDIDEDNSDFETEEVLTFETETLTQDTQIDSTTKQSTYRYVELNNQTKGACTHRISAVSGEELNYPTYLCVDGDTNHFKEDVTKAGLWTMDISIDKHNTVVAIDLPKVPHAGISIDKRTIELACRNANRDLAVCDGPFPETRVFEFPVSYEMYGCQPIRATNITNALKQLENAPLPCDSHYVDESFVIDDDGTIETHN